MPRRARDRADAALAAGRIVGMRDDGPRVGGALDMRHQDSLRARIQHPQDIGLRRAGQAHQRGRAGRLRGAQHVFQRLEPGRAMLEIDDHIVEARIADHFDDRRRRLPDETAEHDVAPAQPRLEGDPADLCRPAFLR